MKSSQFHCSPKRAGKAPAPPPPPQRAPTPMNMATFSPMKNSHNDIRERNRNPQISLQNRPLPPVPPPRKSHLSHQKPHQQQQQIDPRPSHNLNQNHHHLRHPKEESISQSDSVVSDHETNSVSSIYEQISPRKCVRSSVIVKTAKFQFGEKRSGIPSPGFSMAELATRFLEENVRNCIKPRIFPMESAVSSSSSSFNERAMPSTSPPFIIAASETTRIHHHHQRRLIFTPSLVMDGFVASKTALVSKTRPLTSSPNSFPQQKFLQHSSSPNGRMSNSNTVSPSPGSAIMEPGSPVKKGGPGSQNGARSDYASVLRKWSAPIPPSLSRKLGRTESPLGKVKVMLRVCDNPEEVTGTGILGLDKRRKQVTLVDPGGTTPSGITPEERRVGISAPKMFAFDGIFGEDDDQAEICSASGSELVASVVGGEDGCFVSLGYCSAGKKQTMFGKPANQQLGMVPTAISWLFKSILEQKQKTGSRFSVRVSAVEVSGGSGHEVINDLLLPFVNDGDDPPGALLESTSGVVTGSSSKSLSAPVLNSVSEVRAPNPETAGFFLDSALDAMSRKEEPVGHFVFTLHLYQYSVDRNGKGVAGGRSRLHCVMLGNGSPSISVLGGLLLAVLNGQRHLPSSNHSKLGAILRECLGSLTCRAVVMIHVSNAIGRYAETLAALQLGARVHRLRRSRRLKMGSVGSGTGSGGSSGGSGEETRNVPVLINPVGENETGSSDIDPSSSEQSCDTVIYLGPSIDEATDGEHPPVYLPSLETTPGGSEVKIIPSKCHLLPGSNGPPPKTKSPKPKSSKLASDGNFPSPNGKSEEQWVDGPKLAGYKQPNGNHSTGASVPPSPAKKKGETWIDGPAARVQHQSSNFPSPKRTLASIQQQRSSKLVSNGNGPTSNGQSRASCDLSSCQSMGISATKAEMIQKWISNQSPTAADLFDESATHKRLMDQFYAAVQENGMQNMNQQQQQQPSMNCCAHPQFGPIYSCQCLHGGGVNGPSLIPAEPEYKALTVFKTCDDQYDEDGPSLCNGYDFEFIEVVEPEIPVPTRDACFQVTEEDIALSFLEENPLPESDQNFEMSPENYFSRGRSSSFSEISSCISNNSLPKLEKEDDHPLRVLSQECLTVVSTFADSVSISGGDIERFWPRLSFPSDLEMSHHDMSMYPTLCKNDMGQFTQSHHTLSSKLEQMSTESNKPSTRLLLRDLPILSDESIYKVPSPPSQPPSHNNQQKSSSNSKPLRLSAIQPKKYRSGKESSDTEGESVHIPPMELIDTTPITQTCNNLPVNVNPTTQVQPITVSLPMRSYDAPSEISALRHCNHPIHQTGNGFNRESFSVPSSPSRGPLPPPSPIHLPEVTKSPSKSKSRKLSKFFRTRSKSPKTVGATSSSESGKSSISSSDAKSSSSSSCSSGASAPLKQVGHSSPKHMSPSRHSSPSKKQSSRKNSSSCFPSSTMSSSSEYHFTCDSVIPMFIPSPDQKKTVTSAMLSA